MGFAFGCSLACTAHGQIRVEDWPTVRMVISGVDAQGNPLTGLTAETVVMRENRKPVKVDALERNAGPMSVCVVVDMSGSMYDRLPVLRSTIQRFLESLPPEDEVCVVDFSFKAYMPLKFTRDRSLATATLPPLHAYGGTALRDALLLTADYMRTNASEKNQAIVMFSDGGDNSSKIPEKQFWKDVLMPGTPPVYIVRIPTLTPSWWDNRADEMAAQEISRRLGGFTFTPHKGVDLAGSVDRLSALLNNTYVLTYQSYDGQKDGRERRIDVELDKVHQKGKAVIHAPEGYVAPSH